jgi:hypothetical protein
MHDAPSSAVIYGTWSSESIQFLDLWDYNDWTFGGYRDGTNDNIIAYNEIEAVCKETGDAGIIYSGLDWGNQGNIIQYNFIHDVPTNIFNQVANGIYLDECTSGTYIFANTIYNISGIAIVMGGGRDNRVENNVIAKCNGAYYADRRGVCNINETTNDPHNLLAKIQLYSYQSLPWSTAYPNLAAIPTSGQGYTDAKNPGNDTLQKNIGWQNSSWTIEGSYCPPNGLSGALAYISISNNISNQDPLFVDEANRNLKLQTNSPAYLNISGFQNTNFELIGLEY